MSVFAPPARGEWQRRGLICVCACAVALPLAWRGNSCGHDFDFHLQSWLAVAQQWRNGPEYPHWIPGANFAAGEPRFVFYPPLTWLLGALLGSALPWSAAPIAFTLIVATACGFSMYALAGKWLTADAAMLAACGYIVNPYALFVVYERAAYGELAAGIWLPLIVLFALRRKASIASLALAIAAVWLTNAPGAVMSCYLLAGIAVWTAFVSKRWRPILNAVVALPLGLGLASFYLVPAAYERRWVEIARAIGPGMRIEDSFLFLRTGESFHDQVLRIASWIFVTMLATIAVLGWIGWKRSCSRRLLNPLFVTAAVLFLLQLPWSAPIWRVAPELKFLQFPWRWTLVLSMVFALSLAAVAAPRQIALAAQNLRWRVAAVLAATLALVAAGTWLFWQPCDEEDAVFAQVAVFQSAAGFEGTDEYTPLGADNSLVQQGLPQVRVLNAPDGETAAATTDESGNPPYQPTTDEPVPSRISVEQWQPERKTFTLVTQAPAYAIPRLMDYPAWRVRANRSAVGNRPRRDDGLMAIPIPAGTTRIEITYGATPDVRWGRGLSAASLALLLALGLAARRRNRIL